MVYYFLVVFIFLINTFSSVYSQNNQRVYSRTVINKTEKWKPGKIDDQCHVVDSFFYKNGVLKEVSEAIIKRRQFVVVDSMPIKQRKHWDINGKLVLEESFKEGKISSIKSFYPPFLNIIPNGSFEQHTEIPPHHYKQNYGIYKVKPITNILDIDTGLNYQKGDDSFLHTLVTYETVLGGDLPDSKTVGQSMVIKKNGEVIDSICTRILYNVCTKGVYKFGHTCNYSDLEIKVPGWESKGRAFPFIFDVKNKAPNSCVGELALNETSFNVIDGNSFVMVNNFIVLYPSCNLQFEHPLLQTKLCTTLKKGDKYYLEFWMYKSQRYMEENPLHLCFTEEPNIKRTIQLGSNNFIKVDAFNDSIVKGWQKVALEFDAPHFARYLTVGFFLSPQYNSDYGTSCKLDGFVLVPAEQKNGAVANFYLDSLDFTKNSLNEESEMVFNHHKIEKDTPLVLENILFENDACNLLPESLPILLEFALFIKKHQNITIVISGHTDNTGIDAHNMQLSTQRAEAVVLKLVEFGVDINRLSWKGYGATLPITDNNSEEGRAKNRRVDFVVEEVKKINM